MKLSKTLLLILFVISFAGIQCGGSGGSSPNNSLNGKHTVKGFDEVITQVSPDCEEETSVSGGNSVPTGSALSNAEDKIEITFARNTFFIERNGNKILSGTWAQVDGDTLEITAEGKKIKVDYALLEGNVLDVSFSDSQNLNCSSSSGSISEPVHGASPVDQDKSAGGTENFSEPPQPNDEPAQDFSVPTSAPTSEPTQNFSNSESDGFSEPMHPASPANGGLGR